MNRAGQRLEAETAPLQNREYRKVGQAFLLDRSFGEQKGEDQRLDGLKKRGGKEIKRSLTNLCSGSGPIATKKGSRLDGLWKKESQW